MKQFSRVVARNTMIGLVSQLLIKIISFSFTILIVRNLGAGSFGQYSTVIAFGVIFAFISDLGLSNYMVREVAYLRDKPDGHEKIEKLYANNVWIRLALALVTMVLMVLTAWLTERPPEMIGAIAFSSLSFLVWCFLGPFQSVLTGYERSDLVSKGGVVNQIIFVGLGALALVAGTGYFGLLAASMLGLMVMTYLLWRSLKKLNIKLVRPEPKVWKSLLIACLPFGFITFAQGVSYKFDSVLLNIFRGDAETGYYTVAYNLIFSFVLISNMFNVSMYPSLTRHSSNAPEELPAIYERALRYLMVIALPITIGTWALADQIVKFLFGPANLPAAQALQILIWVVPLMFTSEFLSYLVIISGREKRVARVLLVGISFNVLLNIILVPIFGLIGASIMTVVTEAILVIQYLFLLWPILRSLNWGHMLIRPLLTAGLMGALILAVRSLPLFASVALGVVIYAGLALALGVIGRDELRFMRNMRH